MKLWFDMFDRPKNIALSDEAWRAYLHLARLAMESSDFGVINAKDWPSMARTIHMDSRKFRRVIEELSSKYQGKVEISEGLCLELTIVNISEFQSRKPADQPERTRDRKRKQRSVTPLSHPVTPIEKEKEEEGDESRPKSVVGKPDSAPVLEVIEYLNERVGSNFKTTTKASRQRVQARFNEGFTLDDFKRVIDTKAAAWLIDPEMAPYLRPDTLFSTKFEGYLNESIVRASNRPTRAMRAPCPNELCINGMIYDPDRDEATPCPECH